MFFGAAEVMSRVAGIVAAGVVTLVGCALLQPVGDSAFRVQGQIRLTGEPQPDTCLLQVVREENRRIAGERRVRADFLESFTLAPGFHRYFLVIDCQGYPRHQTKVWELGGSRYHSPPLDLGTVDIGGR